MWLDDDDSTIFCISCVITHSLTLSLTHSYVLLSSSVQLLYHLQTACMSNGVFSPWGRYNPDLGACGCNLIYPTTLMFSRCVYSNSTMRAQVQHLHSYTYTSCCHCDSNNTPSNTPSHVILTPYHTILLLIRFFLARSSTKAIPIISTPSCRTSSRLAMLSSLSGSFWLYFFRLYTAMCCGSKGCLISISNFVYLPTCYVNTS